MNTKGLILGGIFGCIVGIITVYSFDIMEPCSTFLIGVITTLFCSEFGYAYL